MTDNTQSGRLSTPDDEHLDLTQLVETLWRHRLLFGAVTVLLTTLAVLYVTLATPLYQARALIEAGGPAAAVSDFEAVVRTAPRDAAAVLGEIEVLRSAELARRVIDDLQLYAVAEFAPADPAGTALPRAPTEELFARRLGVSHVENSRLIAVTFQSEDPVIAAAVVNRLIDFYLLQQREQKLAATRQASGWLNQQVERLQQRIDASERTVEEFRQQNGLLTGSEGLAQLERSLQELDAELRRATTTALAAENQVQQARRLADSPQSLEALGAAADISGLRELRRDEQTLQRSLAELTARYNDRNLNVLAARAELNSVRRQIRARLDQIVDGLALRARLAADDRDSLEQRYQRLEAQIEQAKLAAVQLRSLEREAEASRALLAEFLERQKTTDALNSLELQQPNARVISAALVPQRAAAPRKIPIVAACFVASLFLATLLVFVREHWRQARLARVAGDGGFGFHGHDGPGPDGDSGLRTRQDVENAVGAPLLGLVPKLGWAARRHAGGPASSIIYTPDSPFAQSINDFYYATVVSESGNPSPQPPRRVLITSALPGEGKTTTAACLARAQAMYGRKVILVDANLYQPAVHLALNQPPAPGLAEVLGGQMRLDQVIREDSATGAHVLQAGTAEFEPQRLLDSPALETLLDRLAESYPLVVIDSAPLARTGADNALLRKADLTVLLLRWGSQEFEQTRLTAQRLGAGGGRAIGVLLTMTNAREYARYRRPLRMAG